MTKDEVIALVKAKDSEAAEILADLPFAETVDANTRGAKAEVFYDSDGRLNIILEEGGWLGCKLDHIMGDIAPWAG